MVQPTRKACPALLLAWLLCACGGDPILVRADDERAEEGAPEAAQQPGWSHEPEPGQAPAPSVGEPASPGEGRPDEPAPGIPDEPSPGDPSQPPPPGGAEPGPPPSTPHTVIAGVVRYSDYEGGPIRIDVFDGDQRDLGQHPGVVAWADLQAPGPFVVRVPKSVGKVWITAFNDANGNGRPDDQDPKGYDERSPVIVGGDDVEGVVVTLVYNPQPVE